jgi:hypothetical protein
LVGLLGSGFAASRSLRPRCADLEVGNLPAGQYYLEFSGGAFGTEYFLSMESVPLPPAALPVLAPPAAPGIVAYLVKVKRGQRKRFEVRIHSLQTRQLLAAFVCPFQEPAYRNIRLLMLDSNGDGLADTVQLRGWRGQRRRVLTYPILF